MTVLCVLVGENPLPPYLAARTHASIASDGGPDRILLIPSGRTRPVADRVKRGLEADGLHAEVGDEQFVIVDPLSWEDAARLGGAITGLGSNVLVDITGGTKLSAVDVALSRATTSISYVDDARGVLLVRGREVPLHVADLTLERVLDLHGLRVLSNGDAKEVDPQWWQDVARAQWVQEAAKLMSSDGRPHPCPGEDAFAQHLRGHPTGGFGATLEAYVAWLLARRAPEDSWVRFDVKVELESPQVGLCQLDVVARVGTLLLAVSCAHTRGNNGAEAQLKLAEVDARSRQLFGDLARQAAVLWQERTTGAPLGWESPRQCQVYTRPAIVKWLKDPDACPRPEHFADLSTSPGGRSAGNGRRQCLQGGGERHVVLVGGNPLPAVLSALTLAAADERLREVLIAHTPETVGAAGRVASLLEGRGLTVDRLLLVNLDETVLRAAFAGIHVKSLDITGATKMHSVALARVLNPVELTYVDSQFPAAPVVRRRLTEASGLSNHSVPHDVLTLSEIIQLHGGRIVRESREVPIEMSRLTTAIGAGPNTVEVCVGRVVDVMDAPIWHNLSINGDLGIFRWGARLGVVQLKRRRKRRGFVLTQPLWLMHVLARRLGGDHAASAVLHTLGTPEARENIESRLTPFWNIPHPPRLFLASDLEAWEHGDLTSFQEWMDPHRAEAE